MVRKILAVPFLLLGMAFFMQSCDEPCLSENEDVHFKAGKGGGGGGHTEPVGNNLSFPVFALDGYALSSIQESFTQVYAGSYDGLTDEEIAYVEANGPWYAQKVEGNVWQAGYSNSHEPMNVTFIDWGDVIEASYPVVGRPFRLETTLYVDISDNPMNGYTMALLAFPSSPNETQGTNGNIYEGNWATVVSTSPTLIIQSLDLGAVPEWNQELEKWTGVGVNDPLASFSFAPELNVGGKYIYGASTGGWRPTTAGTYRLTFFMRGLSNISFTSAVIGNYAGNVPDQWETPENRASTPVVDVANNLSFVDVEVVRRR